MTTIDVIKQLKEATFTDEDGGSYQLEFQDGLTKRHPTDLVWVLKNKKKGWFSKFFRKSN